MRRSEIFMEALNEVDETLLEGSENQHSFHSLTLYLGLLTSVILCVIFIYPIMNKQTANTIEYESAEIKEDSIEVANESAMTDDNQVNVDSSVEEAFLSNEKVDIVLQIEMLDLVEATQDTYKQELDWLRQYGYSFEQEHNQYVTSLTEEEFKSLIQLLQTKDSYMYFISLK